MMGKINWLRDVDAGLGQAVLAIALEIWVNLEGKRRMVRIGWPEGESATDGTGVEEKNG